MKPRTTSAVLTERQLDDIIVCVGQCIDHDLGYYHLTNQERSLAVANRVRLEVKLKRMLANFPSIHTRP